MYKKNHGSIRVYRRSANPLMTRSVPETSKTYDNIVPCRWIKLFELIFSEDQGTKANQRNNVRIRIHKRTNCARSIPRTIMTLDTVALLCWSRATHRLIFFPPLSTFRKIAYQLVFIFRFKSFLHSFYALKLDCHNWTMIAICSLQCDRFERYNQRAFNGPLTINQVPLAKREKESCKILSKYCNPRIMNKIPIKVDGK